MVNFNAVVRGSRRALSIGNGYTAAVRRNVVRSFGVLRFNGYGSSV